MIKRLVCLAFFLLGQAFAVHAQETDIVGYWEQPAPGVSLGGVAALFGFIEDAIERADGPPVVDFLGIPLNEEALSRALAYDSALLGVPACLYATSLYILVLGPGQSKNCSPA